MASAPLKISDDQLVQLTSFIELCKKKPEVLHIPQLKFFKDYMESLGAKISEISFDTPGSDEKEYVNSTGFASEEDTSEFSAANDNLNDEKDDSDESEIELDNTGVIEPDEIDVTISLDIDENIEVTEEMIDESNNLRVEGTEAINNGDINKAIGLFTDAIKKNPQCAALYAKRAGAYLKQNKPNAAIHDSIKALSLNPDQALAYKCRGYAHKLLGHWKEAARDLSEALRLDYDDDTNESMKQVSLNVDKIDAHNRKYMNKCKAGQFQKQAGVGSEQKTFEQEKEKKFSESNDVGDASFTPNTPGCDPSEFLSDPEFVKVFSDPEMMAIFKDINENPANIMKHKGNPKMAAIIDIVQNRLGLGTKVDP